MYCQPIWRKFLIIPNRFRQIAKVSLVIINDLFFKSPICKFVINDAFKKSFLDCSCRLLKRCIISWRLLSDNKFMYIIFFFIYISYLDFIWDLDSACGDEVGLQALDNYRVSGCRDWSIMKSLNACIGRMK